MPVRYHDWLTENSLRNYPFLEEVTLGDDEFRIPKDFILDFRIVGNMVTPVLLNEIVVVGTQIQLYIMDGDAVTVMILPIEGSSHERFQTYTAVGVDEIFGSITIGSVDEILALGNRSFSFSAREAQFEPRTVIQSDVAFRVASLGKLDDTTTYEGDVRLEQGDGLTLTNKVGDNAIEISLTDIAAEDPVCDCPPVFPEVQTINNILPDCKGNICLLGSGTNFTRESDNCLIFDSLIEDGGICETTVSTSPGPPGDDGPDGPTGDPGPDGECVGCGRMIFNEQDVALTLPFNIEGDNVQDKVIVPGFGPELNMKPFVKPCPEIDVSAFCPDVVPSMFVPNPCITCCCPELPPLIPGDGEEDDIAITGITEIADIFSPPATWNDGVNNLFQVTTSSDLVKDRFLVMEYTTPHGVVEFQGTATGKNTLTFRDEDPLLGAPVIPPFTFVFGSMKLKETDAAQTPFRESTTFPFFIFSTGTVPYTPIPFDPSNSTEECVAGGWTTVTSPSSGNPFIEFATPNITANVDVTHFGSIWTVTHAFPPASTLDMTVAPMLSRHRFDWDFGGPGAIGSVELVDVTYTDSTAAFASVAVGTMQGAPGGSFVSEDLDLAPISGSVDLTDIQSLTYTFDAFPTSMASTIFFTGFEYTFVEKTADPPDPTPQPDPDGTPCAQVLKGFEVLCVEDETEYPDLPGNECNVWKITCYDITDFVLELPAIEELLKDCCSSEGEGEGQGAADETETPGTTNIRPTM